MAGKIVVMAAFFALVLVAMAPSAAAQNQPQSAVPEVPAGANPQPNGQTGQPGQPQSNSAVPEVPAGATPQPNP